MSYNINEALGIKDCSNVQEIQHGQVCQTPSNSMLNKVLNRLHGTITALCGVGMLCEGLKASMDHHKVDTGTCAIAVGVYLLSKAICRRWV